MARLRDERDEGRSLNDMAVLYHSKSEAEQAEQALQRAGIPFASGLTREGRDELYGSEESVKIVSMHSSKGLEFGLVILPGLGEMPRPKNPEADEARLLYVAMTRSIGRLVMTYQRHSDFTRRVQAAIGAVKAELNERVGEV